MSGHYCTEHEMVFFKKGKMKGYAHPVEGTDPTEWCNEPEEGGDPVPKEVAKKSPAPEPKPEPAPQAVGMITKEIGDMIRSKYLKPLFGDEIYGELINWYRAQTLGITRVPFDSAKLPQFGVAKRASSEVEEPDDVPF